MTKPRHNGRGDAEVETTNHRQVESTDTGVHSPVERLSEAQARALTATIQADLGSLAANLAAAYQGRAWQALGYDSWADYTAAELSLDRWALPPGADRETVVHTLRDAGMSLREIEAATSLSKSTVGRMLAPPAVPDGTPPPDLLAPLSLTIPADADRAAVLLDALGRLLHIIDDVQRGGLPARDALTAVDLLVQPAELRPFAGRTRQALGVLAEAVDTIDAAAVPDGTPEYVALDRRLAPDLERTTHEHARFVWHWTLDESNPDRVSIDAYAEQTGVPRAEVAAAASGYAAWMLDRARHLVDEYDQAEARRDAARDAVDDAVDELLDDLDDGPAPVYVDTDSPKGRLSAYRGQLTRVRNQLRDLNELGMDAGYDDLYEALTTAESHIEERIYELAEEVADE